MKLSTRIKRYVDPTLIWEDGVVGNETTREIVFMVDGVIESRTHSLADADILHKLYLNSWGYKLLPPNECPVVNSTQIIIHYTATTYKDWCKQQFSAEF